MSSPCPLQRGIANARFQPILICQKLYKNEKITAPKVPFRGFRGKLELINKQIKLKKYENKSKSKIAIFKEFKDFNILNILNIFNIPNLRSGTGEDRR